VADDLVHDSVVINHNEFEFFDHINNIFLSCDRHFSNDLFLKGYPVFLLSIFILLELFFELSLQVGVDIFEELS